MNRLNIIHDPRMSERYEPLIQELKWQGITDYKLWSPVEDKNSVVRSINLSHKQIVRDALEKGLEYVIIGEDDLMFPATDGWRYYLANVPETFDLYSGGSYLVDIQNPNRLCGFHCYTVNETFYDAFLSIPDDVHIDSYVDEKLKGNFVVCRPMPALQRPGWSSNNRATVDYNTLLKPEEIYGALSHV